MQELRNIARALDIPIITATQNTRNSEDAQELANSQLGDSIKKLRYTDYLYMGRMSTRTFLDSDVVKDVILPNKNVDPSNPILQNLFDILKPFETKIMKAKDGKKNIKKYMLFCTENLRIYNNIHEYLDDRKEYNINSAWLGQQMDELFEQFIPQEDFFV